MILWGKSGWSYKEHLQVKLYKTRHHQNEENNKRATGKVIKSGKRDLYREKKAVKKRNREEKLKFTAKSETEVLRLEII